MAILPFKTLLSRHETVILNYAYTHTGCHTCSLVNIAFFG